jgi:glycosyltransferase involved in cell wall biosynthesis
MKIAIHAADLDHSRIDGTRVYILNMLKNFGMIAPDDRFFIYHRTNFNSQLAPPESDNYLFRKNGAPFSWTQTRFAFDVWCDKPDVLWMPMHNMPLLRRSSLKTVMTVHDLAFKSFPQYFPKKDLRRLNMLADYSIGCADKLIAVSQSTKNDILKFYPKRKESEIKVIHHGFDGTLFSENDSSINLNFEFVAKTYNLKPRTYILYVGAIQPRKNLEVLVAAFDKMKTDYPELKLVIAGEKAWMWEGVLEKIKKSPNREDIIITGTLPFEIVTVLYRNAALFVFPSLYEGFGIPILEAFASGVPVICAHNSSLTEVGGDAAMYFETQSENDLYEKISQVLSEPQIRKDMIEKGKKRLESFSWKKSAQETLDWLKY